MIIVGAGLSGLLAGALDRHATILERQAELPNNHHAVLRFRDDKISRALDIPFRKVRVHKAIADGNYEIHSVALPHHINGYSKKTLGMYSTRSIMNLEPADRFIAPHNLVEQLAEMNAGRIHFGHDVDSHLFGQEPVLSTIPLPALMKLLGEPVPEFHSAPIRVMKFEIPDADIFQTIYFPSSNTPLYRATITKNELILEMAEGKGDLTEAQLEATMLTFGMDYRELKPKALVRQGFGKIAPINEALRKSLLYRLTKEHRVYSLGRFACWRNILLDDVFDDYWKIKKMIGLQEYDLTKAAI